MIAKHTLTPAHLNAAHDILSTAVEQGISYWCFIKSYTWTDAVDGTWVVDPVEGWEDHLDDVTVGEGDPQFTVTAETLMAVMLDLIHGTHVHIIATEVPTNHMKRLAASWWVSPDDFDYDAIDADALFQFAALGEVVYG